MTSLFDFNEFALNSALNAYNNNYATIVFVLVAIKVIANYLVAMRLKEDRLSIFLTSIFIDIFLCVYFPPLVLIHLLWHVSVGLLSAIMGTLIGIAKGFLG